MKVLIPFCPVCGKSHVTSGHILGHAGAGHTSERKRKASRANGKRGGHHKTPASK